MYVFYGISETGEISVGRFGWTDELSEVAGEPIPEEYGEVWAWGVDLSDLIQWGEPLPRSASEVRARGVPCCCECGDAGDVYRGARCSVVWCEACAADLLPLLEVE